MIVTPHKLTVDNEGNVWVADNGAAPGKGQQVIKFSPDGKVLMTLGKAGVAGTGLDEFDQPTEVAIAPNGDIFVADGHRRRVGHRQRARHEVRQERQVPQDVGPERRGSRRARWAPHDRLGFQGRVFVGDRQNNRIQIYEPTASSSTSGSSSAVQAESISTGTDTLYVADSESDGRTVRPGTAMGSTRHSHRGIRIGSARDGSVSVLFPDPCRYPYEGGSTLAEGVTVDREGNVYGADFTMDVEQYPKAR